MPQVVINCFPRFQNTNICSHESFRDNSTTSLNNNQLYDDRFKKRFLFKKQCKILCVFSESWNTKVFILFMIFLSKCNIFLISFYLEFNKTLKYCQKYFGTHNIATFQMSSKPLRVILGKFSLVKKLQVFPCSRPNFFCALQQHSNKKQYSAKIF